MAMTKCRECGAQVSTNAAACPKCGSKKFRGTNWLAIIIIGVSCIALFRIASETPSSPQPPTPQLAPAKIAEASAPAKPASDIFVDIGIQTDGKNPPALLGTSNLPTGVDLNVTVTRAAMSYMAQDRVTVKNGIFLSKPFGSKAGALLPGDYQVELTSPIPGFMSAAVRQSIGEKGEHLQGPWTAESELTKGVRQVTFKGAFTIAGVVSASADRAYAQEYESPWRYSESDDGMASKKIASASTISINTFNFSFPYEGAQHATLQLRNHPRYGRDVIVAVHRGQFHCGISGCAVRVRFDGGKMQTFAATVPSDYDTTYIFIKGFDRFVGGLKGADSVKIEAPFFKNGNVVMEFPIRNLALDKLIRKTKG